jgi:hypothetical protein
MRSEVVVAATRGESGRFDATEKVVGGDELLGLLDQFLGNGQGYLEVRAAESEFPLLTVGIRGDVAVIHCVIGPERMGLLRGDGSVASDAVVEVPVMDEIAVFSGEVAFGVAAARVVVADFVRTGVLGEWIEL